MWFYNLVTQQCSQVTPSALSVCLHSFLPAPEPTPPLLPTDWTFVPKPNKSLLGAQ